MIEIMGCDIHIRTEIKTVVDEKEKWICSDHYKKNKYYEVLEGEKREWEVVEIYYHRNYGLFTILAGVRNQPEYECICEPKGIPHNICKETKEAIDNIDSDGHSHSYFSLAELMEVQEKYNHEGLNSIIQALKNRYKEMFWMYSDDQVQCDKIRIVFWFDN